MMNGAQIRAARGLLGWSIADLTERSGVSGSTIKRVESGGQEVPNATAASLSAIEVAFRSAGVVAVPENGGGSGVRFAKPASASAQSIPVDQLTTDNDK